MLTPRLDVRDIPLAADFAVGLSLGRQSPSFQENALDDADKGKSLLCEKLGLVLSNRNAARIQQCIDCTVVLSLSQRENVKSSQRKD